MIPRDFILAQLRHERRFELTNLPENWAAVVGLAVLGGLCWWVLRTYRAEARAGSTPAKRSLLTALRCAVIVLLALVWLEPVVATYLHRTIESYTLVLVDGSSSINIKDHYLNPEEKRTVTEFFNELGRGDAETNLEPVARSELIDLLLRGNHGAFLKGLTRNNRVKLYTFSEKTTEIATLAARREAEDEDLGGDAAESRRVGLDPPVIGELQGGSRPTLPLNLSHTGEVTNLGQTLRQAVDSLDGVAAAVVVISDGGFNQGESADVLGRFARASNIPIHTIGIGEAALPRNIKVAEVLAPAQAFINDPFEIQTRLEVAGMEDELVTVELYAQKAGDPNDPVLVDRKSIQTRRGTAQYPLTFQHRGSEPGRAIFRVQAFSNLTEPITEDNSGQCYVNFLDRKMKVLLVSGGPSWTYRFVSRLLQRDETFNLSCWLQTADRTAVRDGNTIIDHLPDGASELFEYDVIVLLDPDARQFPTGWSELVDTHLTRNGAGLMYCAARKHAPLFFHTPSVEPLIQLLPVAADPEADLILNEVGYYQRQSSPVEFPRGALDHPILSWSSGVGELQGSGANSGTPQPQNFGTLKRLVRVYWHYPVRHEKAAATVLMRHGHPRMRNSAGAHVLLATHFVGAGRATFLGFDGTWRWRQFGEERFNSFWVQNIRHLAQGRLLGAQTRGRILTDRNRYTVGEPIVFRARLRDRNDQPLTQPDIPLQISTAGEDGPGARVVLHRDPNREGWYTGQFVARRTGRYTATIRLEGNKPQEEMIVTHAVDVRRSDLEILKPQMDRSQLITLAQQSAGGRYYDISQALSLPRQIRDRHETTVTRGAIEPLWDTGWALALLAGLLCLEWALRKRWQLL